MTSRALLCLPLLLAMLPLAAQGQAPAPAGKPAQLYTLKHRSSFASTSDDQRAPFWPIGWTKRRPMSAVMTPVQQVDAPKVQFDASTVRVTSILLGTPSLAIINGRSYSEGDYLRQPRGAATAGSAAASAAPRVRVFRINDGSVALQHQAQIFTVALTRPELVQRGPGEELLTEDRP